MAIHKRGKFYSYAFSFRGVRYWESSKSRDKDVCRRLEAEHRRRLESNQGGLTEITRPKPFSAAARAYLQDREAHWAQKTQIIHANSLRHLEPFFGKLMLNEITGEHISRYQGSRKKEKGERPHNQYRGFAPMAGLAETQAVDVHRC